MQGRLVSVAMSHEPSPPVNVLIRIKSCLCLVYLLNWVNAFLHTFNVCFWFSEVVFMQKPLISRSSVSAQPLATCHIRADLLLI